MKRVITAADNLVKLHVEYKPYERYETSGIKKANITAPTEREALAKMADNMNLYITGDEIRDEASFPETNDIIEEIAASNGDGCDFIYELKNVTDNFLYIDEGQGEEEDW